MILEENEMLKIINCESAKELPAMEVLEGSENESC